MRIISAHLKQVSQRKLFVTMRKRYALDFLSGFPCEIG